MKRKKLLAFFASILLIFCLQACLKKNETAKTQVNNQPEAARVNAPDMTATGGVVSVDQSKPFRGSIGKYKIEMRLLRDNEQVTGTYAYAGKSGGGLNVKGTVDRQGNLTLQESDQSGKQTGLFKGKWNETDAGITLEGDWSKPDGQDETGFYLVEQHVEFRNGWRLVTKQIKENNKGKYTLDAEYPQVEGSSDASVQKLNGELSALVTKEVNEWKKGAGEVEPGEDPTPSDMVDDLEITYNTALATNELVSIAFNIYTYPRGAAHGSTTSSVVNYDLKAGKSLKLSDLFQPRSDYLRVISDYCIKDLKKQMHKLPEDERIITDEGIEEGAKPTADNYNSWNITRKGLLINFDVYQLGAYAAGSQEVVVPYNALGSVLKPDGPLAGLDK